MIKYQTACELAREFPAELADFMDLETGIRSGRFREETMTDLLLAALVKLPGVPLELITPPENSTGSDLDVVIVDFDSMTQVAYRIQAKRLSLGAQNWDRNSFAELAHRHNTGSQHDTLTAPGNLAGPPRLTPLYAFYIPQTICSASSGHLEGIQLAPVGPVEAAIRDIKARQLVKGRSQARQLRHLSPHFFSLQTLFCPMSPTGSQGRGICSPSESAAQVGRALARGARSADGPLRDGRLRVRATGINPEVSKLTKADAARLDAYRRNADSRIEPRRERRGDFKRPRIVLDGTPPTPSDDVG